MILNNYYNLNSSNTNERIKTLINNLDNGLNLSKDQFLDLLNNFNYELLPYIQDLAFKKRKAVYHDSVYIRGLIEISNYCKNNCYYCGIRKNNDDLERYRYNKNEIYQIVDYAYHNGYKTIVLQGGEDDYYSDDLLIEILTYLRSNYPDLALTLSLGERSYESYYKLYQAGANRYLLRHESASAEHYSKLHPQEMKLTTRINCLNDLKTIGYQTGAGLMVGSPYQTNNDLVDDLLFLQSFQPEMIGIGPYLNHPKTPFKSFNNGDINHVLVIYALARLICPEALIPSTTATSSLASDGRYRALQSGCNVIMINLSLLDKRKNYSLYANKTYVGDESQEYLSLIKADIEKAHLKINFAVGNHITREVDNNE
ncbi:[FeFe] hydrogenase H-cluster radical SAM maturase HydE [Erysipelotrichaceae bacterium OttesenSCG-928-M19]|nr:[FeFe] hydrogenase H-cluster radical SAM maturase HydE [Erysipelotrichaceae bacterium OttesenSCG-928-M19]